MKSKDYKIFWYHNYEEESLLPDEKCVIFSPLKSKSRLLAILDPVLKNQMLLRDTSLDLRREWTVLCPKMASEMVCYTLCVTAAYLTSISDKEIKSLPMAEHLKRAESLQGRKHSWFCRHETRTDFDLRFAEFLIRRTLSSLETSPTP